MSEQNKAPAVEAEPYAYVYEYDSFFGVHQSLIPGVWNGLAPFRAIPVYLHPAKPCSQCVELQAENKTLDAINAQLAQRVHELEAENEQLQALAAQNKTMREALIEVSDLISESHGVYGLHLNGDPSPWSEIEQGGRFERLTLLPEALSLSDLATPILNKVKVEILRRAKKEVVSMIDAACSAHPGSYYRGFDQGCLCAIQILERIAAAIEKGKPS